MPDFPDDLVKLFSSKKRNLANEFQKFLLNKSSDKLASIESIETFMRGFDDLNSSKIREFLKFVFGEISPEIYEALKFKLEFENQDEKIEFLKYKLKKSIKITEDGIDTENLDLSKILSDAKIDLNEVFNNLQIVRSSSSTTDVESQYRYKATNNLQAILDDPNFTNYLKAEFVLAELLGQIYPEKESKFSRIVECDDDNNPDDTRLLIVKFVNSYTPQVYLLDPGIRKPSNDFDISNIDLDTFNEDPLKRKFLTKTLTFYLAVFPYLQYSEDQLQVLNSKLSSLDQLIKNNMDSYNDLSLLPLALTHFYLSVKNSFNDPEEFLRSLFDELLSEEESLVNSLKDKIPVLASSYKAILVHKSQSSVNSQMLK